MRNWCESNPESSSPTTPDSPILGVIKDSTGADTEGVGTSGEAEKSTLALTDDAKASPSLSTDREAGGSGNTGTRIIPFQYLPTSVHLFTGSKSVLVTVALVEGP